MAALTWLRTPLLPVALAFGAGIAVGALSPVIAWWVLWLAGLGAAAIAVAIDRPAWSVAPILLAALAVGALRVQPAALAVDDIARLAMPRAARVEGRIDGDPVRYAPDRVRVVVDVERLDDLPRSGRVQLTIAGDGIEVAEGQRIAADARLRTAMGFRNPGGFDYAAFLARDGIRVVGTAPADRMAVTDPSIPWHVAVRQRALGAIGRALPPVSSALLGGLLLGTRGELPHQTLDDFRRAGVYHVLAVSGFNVALVAAAAFTALLIARASRRVAAVAAIVVVIGFAFVAGPQPSVVRAAIMGVLVLAALLLDREASVLNSLALGAIVVLAMRPADLLDPGFQLSFAATAGIVLAPIPTSLVGGGLAVSLAAQLAVLPVSLSHFNQVSVIGIVANLGVVPLAAVATVLGLIAVAASWIADVAGAPLFNAVWPVLLLLRALVNVAAAVPGALVHLPAPHWTAIVAYVASLLLALAAWHVREPRPSTSRACGALAFWLLVAACAIEAWPIVRPGDDRLRVTILDVGQGDAIVVETPDRRVVLVDAGSGGPQRLDAGERVVAPFLWNRGLLRLAGLVTTHADVDHAGGIASIRRLFGVDDDLSAAPDGTRRWLGGVALGIHTIADDPGVAALPRNDTARVVTVEYVAASFLLASDIGARGERLLLARGTDVGATVLKVAHHGARGSSTGEFLRRVQPAIAVISVGDRNGYGHPHAETIRRLGAIGARVYRTDRDGAVVLETDGRVLDVRTTADGGHARYCLDPDTTC